MNLNEQVSRIKNLIYELSPQSSGVQEFLDIVRKYPELLPHMGFKNFARLEEYIDDATYEDFIQLQDEAEYFFNRRKKYFKDEMDEFQRAAQDLNRDEGMNVSVDELISAFARAHEQTLTPDIWSELENTESNEIKKGEFNKVIQLANKYGKSNPSELKRALKSGDYRRPLIVKFGNRYHLVAGNTRLCTAASMGIKPQVLIAEL
jgi:hypothetical protein